MKENISEFIKTKQYLVCVDSDGCAMDTMDFKHQNYFGPKAIEVWGLEKIEHRFMEIWNMVNLYSMTRGINRFKGLVKTFELVAQEGLDIPNVSSVKQWTETTNELSNRSLEKEMAQQNDIQLEKALQWSNAVNEAIAQSDAHDQPFPRVKDSLATISEVADVAIVSSANSGAVRDEWTRHDLVPHVQIMLGQEAGTKAHCIGELLKFDYDRHHVVMVGDAPGDLDAAQQNGVFFYPILVGKEEFSWQRLKEEAIKKLLDGTFTKDYQTQLIEEFHSNLQ